VTATTVDATAAARERVPPGRASNAGSGTFSGRGTMLGLGFTTMYLSVVVILPLAAIVVKGTGDGLAGYWRDVTAPEALSALRLTILASLGVAAINVVMGTLIAWVLVRDKFFGKHFVDMLIDLPFALPTIVAGLVLVALYGPQSPVHLSLAYTRPGVIVALLFVTLPFSVRTVQPVLMEIDTEMEEAAASLGASRLTTFRRIVLPNLMPAILAGAGLSFARALGEYGSTVLISGNIPFKTEIASVQIYNQIENDNVHAAAAVATVLLAVSVVVLFGIGQLARRWAKS
jgi:sulfate transport system permease protein